MSSIKETENVQTESSSDIDEDGLLDALDNDETLAGYREQRLEQLKREAEHVRDLREIDHGKYTEVDDEKEVIRISAIVGFEQLGNVDDFPTSALEMRLRVSGAISNSPSSSSNLAARLGISSRENDAESDDEESQGPKRKIRSSNRQSDDDYDL
ncbi:SubName: Full=Related to PLP1-Phosducin homologue likely to be involved in regulation of pheromone response {ECO:0000313/EMBL:CCA70475.1} [Serendipita indica DSM 11827]|nr:SubName: Full=Related to PLP1-Phosducin homologue likely to be involved in regulation of pheromone response {ECO:0000313/EMBL:CCA70475.1} [Serendipita indica DSM 11827]